MLVNKFMYFRAVLLGLGMLAFAAGGWAATSQEVSGATPMSEGAVSAKAGCKWPVVPSAVLLDIALAQDELDEMQEIVAQVRQSAQQRLPAPPSIIVENVKFTSPPPIPAATLAQMSNEVKRSFDQAFFVGSIDPTAGCPIK